MAALVLSVAGGAAGSVFGPAGAIAGRIAGALLGSVVDRSLFATSQNQNVQGPRLADLDVMASTEGAPIPRVYGRARLSGQVIWATHLEEVVSTRTESSGGGGGGKGGAISAPASSVTTTTYSYYANFAVGLCEGEIGHVGRIWADGSPLDMSGLNIRVHRGSEDQSADDLIVAKEGAENAPAYRGLAYVVFERLPLDAFGNRIPQLSFEIVRPIGLLERMTRAVTLIPGTTEFGYETSPVVRVLGPGQSAPENRHVTNAASDVIASLDDLQATCPNLERVAIVAAWFGDDLRAGTCSVRPGVDNAIKVTSGATWSVAGLSRGDAYVVSQVDGRPAYGGTPSDDSLRHLIAELKSRGIKVTLYPFLMMDIAAGNTLADPYSSAASQPAYPWRGRITCAPAPGVTGSPDGTTPAATQVAHFFSGGSWNYRTMILHYANLAASCGGVDAFLIGSELKALTRVRSASGVYPAVSALVTLASDVKAILGTTTAEGHPVAITYGADWTEYGSHVIGSEVRFPLDPLWASSAINAVGIDYYAPLSDWRDDAGQFDMQIGDSIYDRDYLASHLNSGEAYDWYYADDAARATQTRSAITDGLGKPWIYRAKDLWGWWNNAHIERVGGAELGSATAWTPRSKPIWLTELGCPAVDKGSNQPSVFPDTKSSEGNIPYFSSGARDDLIQRRYLESVLSAFDPDFGDAALNPVSPVYGGRMIDVSGAHLWSWDARPYPVFPNAQDVWSDAPNWQTGHWLTGRLGSAPMDALVAAILDDAQVEGVACDDLREGCDGYVVDRPMTPRDMIDPLAMAYAFDASVTGGALNFRQRGGAPVAEISEDDLVDSEKSALATLTRGQETELPREVSFGFTDSATDYRRSAVMSRRLVGGSNKMLHSDFAVVTSDAAATRRAEIWLQDLWAGRESAQFAVGMNQFALEPGDVIGLTINGRRRLCEISELVDTESRQIKARSIDPEIFSVPLFPPRVTSPAIPPALGPVQALVLDLPIIDSADPPVLTRIAIFADPWPGSVSVWQSADGLSFARAAVALAPSLIGETLDDVPAGPSSRWDRGGVLHVQLYGGALASVADLRVLGGANAAAVLNADNEWEILQFANAELVGEREYKLTRLLRGQAGSEYAIASPLLAGSPFVVLDDHVIPIARGLNTLDRPIDLRVVATGRSHDDPSALALTVTPQATALLPLSPVHVKAERQSDGIHVSWIRRTRRDGDNWTVEVPLGEDAEAYELDILSGSTVLRTISSTMQSALYTNTMELADFGTAQTSLHVRVVQLSSTVGRGHPAELTLTL